MNKNRGFTPILILILVIGIIGLVAVAAFSLGLQKGNTPTYTDKATLYSYPTTHPSPITDPTVNWKTYTITPDSQIGYESYQIKLPTNWIQIGHSSNFQNNETFWDKDTNFTYQLIIHQEININPETSKPYTTLRELTGLSYDVPVLIADSQSAAQILPRAGSESDYKVLFFSKDNKLTFSIVLDTPNNGTKIEEGKILFNQILSTFKFTQ